MDGSPAINSAHWRACPAVRVPEPAARRLAWLRWRLDPASAPPGLLPYTMHPWVVANDRIKAAGWVPAFSNEEAYVAGHRPTPWATVSPQRRQEIALAGLGRRVVGLVAGVVGASGSGGLLAERDRHRLRRCTSKDLQRDRVARMVTA